ncbi:hypothetical protein [Bacillus cereus]|uniref:hypothetical protein n=1 Tax=Bacillus cereus TaxID=1396 RepID=UPI001155776D|nr:hypothetical protein [Bacillus cereus]
MKKVEKVRIEVKQKIEDVNWEDCPVILDRDFEDMPKDYSERTAIINEKMEELADVYESRLRWNYYGSLQGNYVGVRY